MKKEIQYDPSQYPVLFGEELEKAIIETKQSREPLIKHLVYKNTATLLYSPDGVGKSVLALQMALQSTTTEGKVFAQYEVAQPCKTIYFQMERHIDESYERLKKMTKIADKDYKNLVVDSSLQGLFVNNEESLIKILTRIDWIVFEAFGSTNPDLIIIDPIYTLLPSGFNSDESIFYLNSFSQLIQNKYKCSVLFTHHANRGQRNYKTGKREEEDLFGSRFLRAHFSVVYSIKSETDEDDNSIGTLWKLEKSTYRNTDQEIHLTYDPDSTLSFIRHVGVDGSNKKDMIDSFLLMRKKDLKSFTIAEIIKFARCSHYYATCSVELERPFLDSKVPKSKSSPILYTFKSRSN